MTLKRKGIWLDVANFLVAESFVFAAVLLGLVALFLQSSYKTKAMPCPTTFCLYCNGKIVYL